MTINVLRGRRVQPDEATAAPAIGEADSEIFDCPSCSRPLARGVGRCPGCRTRLLLGIEARRAAQFIAAGIVVGVLIGALTATAIFVATRPAASPPTVGDATSSMSDRTDMTGTTAAGDDTAPSTGSGTAPEPAIPAASLAALRQTAIINTRLAGAIAVLQAELAAPAFDTVAVVRTLRGIAADAAVASDVAPRIGAWRDAAGFTVDLRAFYASVRATAHEGLSMSLLNADAYRAAATKMVGVLAGLVAIDQRTQALAGQAGVTIPSVTLPPGAKPAP